MLAHVAIALVASAGSLVPVAGESAAAPIAIVGGRPVASGGWPDAAGIVYQGGVVACGGTLIAPELVLTAEHCLDGDPVAVALDTTDLERPGEIIGVLGAWRAPAGYDAAVLVLERAATARPRVIARGCALDELTAGTPAVAVGFGATDRGGLHTSAVLREVEVEVRELACDDPATGCESAIPADAELVAGGWGYDSCRGDSGGPLYLTTDHGSYLVGVTSRGVDDGISLCGDGGIYVRADHLAPMIESAFGRALAVPTCRPRALSADARDPELADEAADGCRADGRGPASPLPWLAFAILAWSWIRPSKPDRRAWQGMTRASSGR